MAEKARNIDQLAMIKYKQEEVAVVFGNNKGKKMRFKLEIKC